MSRLYESLLRAESEQRPPGEITHPNPLVRWTFQGSEYGARGVRRSPRSGDSCSFGVALGGSRRSKMFGR